LLAAGISMPFLQVSALSNSKSALRIFHEAPHQFPEHIVVVYDQYFLPHIKGLCLRHVIPS
jgi:hypothetical protein